MMNNQIVNSLNPLTANPRKCTQMYRGKSYSFVTPPKRLQHISKVRLVPPARSNVVSRRLHERCPPHVGVQHRRWLGVVTFGAAHRNSDIVRKLACSLGVVGTDCKKLVRDCGQVSATEGLDRYLGRILRLGHAHVELACVWSCQASLQKGYFHFWFPWLMHIFGLLLDSGLGHVGTPVVHIFTTLIGQNVHRAPHAAHNFPSEVYRREWLRSRPAVPARIQAPPHPQKAPPRTGTVSETTVPSGGSSSKS